MNQYTVNNTSYLKMYKETQDFISPNKVDNLVIAVNNISNKAVLTNKVLSQIDLDNSLCPISICDLKLYVHNVEVDEYDNGFNNVLVHLRSENRSELLGLSELFRINKAMLLVNEHDDTIYISDDIYEFSQVKKAYPVAVPVGETGNEFIIHHNFFGGTLYVYKKEDKYILELIKPSMHPDIQDMLWKKFNEFSLVESSVHALIEKFYNGFCPTDKNIEADKLVNEIDSAILEYKEMIKSHQDKIASLEKQKQKLLTENKKE